MGVRSDAMLVGRSLPLSETARLSLLQLEGQAALSSWVGQGVETSGTARANTEAPAASGKGAGASCELHRGRVPKTTP